MPFKLGAAIGAGIISGVVATIAQIVLWWAFLDGSWVGMLNRDARLTAAMLMGREVLPPPATVDWQVLTVATLIHFALSIGYSIIFATFASHLKANVLRAAGLVYGLAIYGVNMYGMTLIFPWFSVVRDWITLLAHLVFGISLVIGYRKLSSFRSRRFP